MNSPAAARFQIPLPIFAALAAGVFAIVASGGLALRMLEQQADEAADLASAIDVSTRLDQHLLLLATAESVQRGYLLSGNDAQARTYDDALAALESELATLSSALQTMPALVGREAQLKRLTQQKFAQLTQGVRLKRDGDDVGVQGYVSSDQPQMLTEQIVNLVTAMQREQHDVIVVHTLVVSAARAETRRTLVFSTALLFALFAAAAFFVVRNVLQRSRELWLREGEAGVARALLVDKGSGDVGGPVIRFLADYLGAAVGAFFTGAPTTGFSLRGSYALSTSDRARVLTEGDGITGQAITTRKARAVTGLSADYLGVGSATGQSTSPTSVLVLPVVMDDEVNGVVELVFVAPLHGTELQLLERVAAQIALGIRSADYRHRLEDQLEETQRQAEQLQAQQEELRVNNEELEEQGRSLREAHARLEEHQNALEESNEKLQAQTTVMGRQQIELERVTEEVVAKNIELERSSRYKSNFLANMSHELRTPLNSSLILAKLLAENKDNNLTDEQVTFAETIHDAGNDLLELINDVLDLSKIEAGHVEIKPQTVSVSAVSASLTRLFSPVAATRALPFSVVIKPDVPATIETDALRVEQVLKNLLSNAFKFTEHGAVSLTISRVDGEHVRFAVTDTGMGIPDDQHEFIFEAFRQLDDGTARMHGGTGLGLSISRDLTQLLGGTLTLTSELGHGSTFALTVPTTLSASPKPSPPPLPELPPLPPKPKPPKRLASVNMQAQPSATTARTILIVEDDATFAGVLADVARGAGFEPLLAETADAAFELALHHVPHAVLLDVRLPDHSGLSVLDRLKRTARTRHIPVHMISGVSDQARTAMVMGAVGYTMKPVRVDDLRDVLARLTDRVDAKLKRVLVIEADEAQRESVRALLAHEHVEVSVAGTAADARRRLQEHTFDCVVMDLSFPDESGQQLLQTMSATADHAFPPVIVYTAKALSKRDEDALRQYSSSIIVKGARSPERLLDEVTLFLHQVESELPAERQRMLRQSRDREQIFEGRTLLIVEDDVRNIFALSRVLEPRGAKIEIARNGLEALEQLQAHPQIELVLMDTMMPEMDGLEAMRRIRLNPQWASLPIISLTAKAMRDDQERCLAAGANDYVAKPIDVDKLLSLIRVWDAEGTRRLAWLTRALLASAAKNATHDQCQTACHPDPARRVLCAPG